MDLIEYVKFRWLPLAIVAVLGLGLIVALGQGLGKSGYDASAKLVISPSDDERSVSGFSLDHYINAEMAVVGSPDNLKKAADGTNVNANALGRAFSAKHVPGTDTATMTVHLDNASDAVTLVNKLATDYVADAKARAAAPLEEQKAALEKLQKKLAKQLAAANAEIESATAAYRQANPNTGIPGAQTLAPQAASQVQLLGSQYQKVSQNLIDLEDPTKAGDESSVLNDATKANPPAHWDLPTYASAVVGLLLVLLVLAGLGLLLTRRVLSEARWNSFTAGSGLQRILPITHRRHAQRQRNVERALLSLEGAASPDAETLVVYLPGKSASVEKHVEPLLTAMEERGMTLREIDDLGDAWTALRPSHAGSHVDPQAVPDTRVLLVTSRLGATREDAAIVVDRPGPYLSRVVPVLV